MAATLGPDGIDLDEIGSEIIWARANGPALAGPPLPPSLPGLVVFYLPTSAGAAAPAAAVSAREAAAIPAVLAAPATPADPATSTAPAATTAQGMKKATRRLAERCRRFPGAIKAKVGSILGRGTGRAQA